MRMSDNVTDLIIIWTLKGCAAFFLLLIAELSHPVHVLGAGIGGKHTEDPRAAADVQDDFVFEHVLVVVHGVPVGQRAHLVFQHLLFELEIKARVHSCDT